MRRKMVLLIDIFVERALKASHPMLTHILHNLRTDEKTVFLALKMILNGMSLRAAAETLEVKL